MDTVMLSNFTLPSLWRFDPTFDNVVQDKSAGWNILHQTPSDLKFYNHFLLYQILDTTGLWPNLAHKGISFSTRTHFFSNEK